MHRIRFMSVTDSLLLLRRKNISGTKIDTSCIPVDVFNKLIDWEYVELIDGNSGLRITEKGENIIAFNSRNRGLNNDAAIKISD